MNIRKNILSLAAIIALSNSVVADDTATYMPLASETVDSSWIMFGVNGFSDGTPSTVVVAASGLSLNTQVTEVSLSDQLATADANGWISIQALQDSSGVDLVTASLAIAVTTTGTPDSTEPERSMYFNVSGSTDTTPNVKFNYRASLEGQAFEVLLGTTLYAGVISQDATYSAQYKIAAGTTAVSTTNDRKAITEVLDFNFQDNPVDPRQFDSSVNLNTTGTASSFFYFNAVTQQWEINQKGAPAEAQDFTDFEIGKSYWGRADRSETLGAQTIDNGGSIGLVLGDATAIAGIPNPDRYKDDQNASILTEGWNMLSFDDNKPYIRHAATGFVMTGVTNSDEAFTITDSSGLNSIALTAFAAGGNEVDVTVANREIESAKLRGLLPTAFNLKFYVGSAAGEIVILSDEKFSITQAAGTAVTSTKTLFNKDPFVSGLVTAVPDLTAVTATAAYGEYALVVNALTGASAADSLGANTGGFSKIIYSDKDGDTVNANRAITVAGTTTIAQAATQIALMGVTIKPVVTQIDTNFDGTGDMLIVASSQPFSIEDATYQRVFNIGAAVSNTAGDSIIINGSADANIVPADTSTATDVATLIEGQTATTKIFAAADAGGQQVILASTEASLLDLKDANSATTDIFTHSSSTDLAARGAVSGIYTLDAMARTPLNQVTDTITSFTTAASGAYMSNDATDTFVLTVNGVSDAAAAMSTLTSDNTIVDTYGEIIEMFDSVVALANTSITTAGTHAYASHNYTLPSGVVAGDLLTAGTAYTGTITITGVDVTDTLTFVITDDVPTAADVGSAAAAAATGDNKVNISQSQLVSDLKQNRAYSPNYAIYGPLYTLRDAGSGYKARAMLRATTEMDTATLAGIINWDSIDLTRPENEWFANNEFNLFNINHNSGYWVYLLNKDADTVSVAATGTFDKTYSQYFSNTLNTGVYSTKNVMKFGQLSITITGLDDVVAGSAYAIVGGEEVALKRTGVSDVFTANISEYGLISFTEGGITDVKVRAVNGKGEAVSALAVVNIDYEKPTSVSASVTGGTDITMTADAGTTKNFYLFKDNIPEDLTLRDAKITAGTASEVALTTGSTSVSFNACAQYVYGVENNLRIVGTDGAKNISNYSDAFPLVYASLLKSANILAHDPSSTDLKAQLGDVYDATCTKTGTQTLASENAGVSVASLDGNNVLVARMSFQPITGSTFDQSTAWTSNFEINNGDGAFIQVQNTPEYAGKAFFVEYNNVIYKGAFPADKTTADQSIGDPIDLAGSFTAANTSLAN
ncbi:hypothetical protein JHD49_04375 [Sulfurimonas sp. SAG-AH-194-C21]|nr:hypothetical protein [Sulfurimonas sp. SAG-AH-194-C21]MDF1883167.1 hypothetical protein [Sulfurimonas sp. SAG-AH-194-C21]